jgi:glycosyltransferase involved in cell wall biosynthesis
MNAYNINNIDLLILGQIKNSQTERLENFFKNKFNKIYIVGFSNIFNMDGKILQKIYLNKKLIFTKEFSIKYKEIKNEIDILINFLKLFITLKKILKKKKINIAIGIALFSSLVCCYFKIKKNINKYVYFCLDYYISNKKIFNKIYVILTHLIDSFVFFYSSKIWSISYRLAKLRNTSDLNKSLIVPNGCIKNNLTKPYNFSSRKIVFVGTISKNHALIELCEIMKKLNKNFGVKLEIVGSGPYINVIKNKIIQLKLEKIVKLHGFIESDNRVNQIIQNASICFCVWTSTIDDNSNIADPGKPKLYTSQNRPMIISNNVYISKFVKKFNAGLVVNSNKKEIYNALKIFFSSYNNRKKIFKNLKFIKKMWDTKKILNRAYNNLLFA